MTEPFRLPDLISYELDLPIPPSINALWSMGKGRLRTSSIYQAWKNEADQLLLAQRKRPSKTIAGPFSADIKLSRERRKQSDLDNRATKALFDYLQSRLFIANDKACERYSVEWTDHANAPWGARVIVKELCGEKTA